MNFTQKARHGKNTKRIGENLVGIRDLCRGKTRYTGKSVQSSSNSTNCSETQIDFSNLPSIRMPSARNRVAGMSRFENVKNLNFKRNKENCYLRKSIVLQNLIENFSVCDEVRKEKEVGDILKGIKGICEKQQYKKDFEELFKDDFKTIHYNLNKKVSLAKTILIDHKKQKMRALDIVKLN